MSVSALGRDIGMPPSTISGLFRGKHEILLEICERHLDALLVAVEQADLPEVTTRRRLDVLARALLEAIGERAPAHRVLMIGLTRLGADRQRDLRRKQSWLAALFAEALDAVLPGLARRRPLADAATKSLTLLLSAGEAPHALGRADYARFAVSLVLGGVRSEIRNGSR